MDTSITVILCIIIGFGALAYYLDKRKREQLLEKYKDKSLVSKLMDGKIWQGMTKEQLFDSWGRPADTSTKVYKTKTTDTYKYDRTGKNRFEKKAKLENGLVVGWDIK